MTNNTTIQARRDYSQHNGGLGVCDVHQDVPGDFLEGMMLDYYRASVCVSSARCLEVESVPESNVHMKQH